MTFVLPLLSVSFGLLVASTGAGLWNARRAVPGLSRSARVMRALAGGLAAGGAAWWIVASTPAPGPGAYLALMAAVAALPLPRVPARGAWVRPVRAFPALWLAGATLILGVERPSPAVDALMPTLLAFALCGGLAARALGDALVGLLAGATEAGNAEATYLLLTLLVGGSLLVDLWRFGGWLGGRGATMALVGPWLAWVAVRFLPRRWARVRAAGAGFAALLLIGTLVYVA